MKAKSLTAAALVLCLLAPAGCGGKKAKSPKDAAKNFGNSLLKNDKDLFLSSVYYGDADKELVEAQFEMMAAMTEFVVEFEKAYGTGKFKGSKPIITEEDLENLEVEGSGDTAVARSPSGGEDIKLIKKDGIWYVDIADAMPKGEQAAQAKKVMGPMAEGIRKVTANIGKKGYDEKKIMGEFMAAMMGAAASARGG